MRRQKNKERKAQGLQPYPKPTQADVLYHAGVGAIEMAHRHKVDAVLDVSAMFLHPDVVILLKSTGKKVVVLFTETPYDIDQELKMAALVDGCWTHERSCLPDFKAVNKNSGYLPHGWHPERHFRGAVPDDVPSHDVVFVGSGFPERIEWFNAIDWTGIDLGLYGSWEGLGLKPELSACIQSTEIGNDHAVKLYRRAKIGLNLYRVFKRRAYGTEPDRVVGQSLSPRAYELAACGVFHLSDYRPEVAEIFGDLVPTFTSPAEAETLIRRWIADDDGRARVAAQLPACVAEASWVARAATVIGDVQALLRQAEVAA
jgi:spore maturation protein CgeB